MAKITGADGNGSAPMPPSEWRSLIANGVTEGSRNNTVAKVSGYFLRRFVDPHVVLTLLQFPVSSPRPASDAGQSKDRPCQMPCE